MVSLFLDKWSSSYLGPSFVIFSFLSQHFSLYFQIFIIYSCFSSRIYHIVGSIFNCSCILWSIIQPFKVTKQHKHTFQPSIWGLKPQIWATVKGPSALLQHTRWAFGPTPAHTSRPTTCDFTPHRANRRFASPAALHVALSQHTNHGHEARRAIPCEQFIASHDFFDCLAMWNIANAIKDCTLDWQLSLPISLVKARPPWRPRPVLSANLRFADSSGFPFRENPDRGPAFKQSFQLCLKAGR